eukprot:2684530-Amphidinium_carterae.1
MRQPDHDVVDLLGVWSKMEPPAEASAKDKFAGWPFCKELKEHPTVTSKTKWLQCPFSIHNELELEPASTSLTLFRPYRRSNASLAASLLSRPAERQDLAIMLLLNKLQPFTHPELYP